MASASRTVETHAPAGSHPLAGIRIVEAGGGLALRLAGRLLADAGAAVVRAPLADDPLLAQPYGADWAAWLDEGKPVSDDVEGDVAVAWLLLTSHAHGSPLGCDTALARHPRLLAACVTPFGQDGPRAGQPGDDVVAAALSGLADATPGFPDMQATADDPPVQSLAPLAEAGGAYIAALAVFGALHARLRGAPGARHVEVSTVEAAAALMVFEWAQHAFGGPIRGRRPDSPELAPNCYVATADGTAAIVAFTDPHWARLKLLMGSPSWADDPDFTTSISRGLAWERLRPHLEAWAAAQPGQALLEAAQAVELPTCCSLRLVETLTSEQAAVTGAVADGRIADPVVLGGRRRRRPAPVAAADLLPPREVPAGVPAGPLAGVRVLDLGQVVAGPWTGTLLAALGADVTFVEPPGFPLSRRFGPFVGEPLHDAGAVFSQVSRGKRSLQIDVKSAEGHELLYGLVRTHDVLLENFSRDAAEALGLGYAALRAQNEGIVVASISGFGRQGPWGSYAAFHSGVLLLSGNADVTRDGDGGMRLAGAIYPDFLTGTVTAFAIAQALALREQTGEGRHLEIAMLDVLLTSMGGLAPAALRGEQFAEHPARFVREGHGYAVEHAGLRTPVLDIGQVMADEHLRARGFVLAQEHPVSGVRSVAAVPWRYDSVRPELQHAPLLDGGRGDLPGLLAPRA